MTKAHACLEAPGQYREELAEWLYSQGHLVSVVNPTRIKRYGKSTLHRNKTDKADADLISEFCLKETPDPWKQLSPEIKHLRALICRLQELKDNRRQEDNRLKSGVKDDWVINDLKTHLNYLDERIKATEKEIKDLIKKKLA